jgi:hypothetical protein
LSLLLGRDGGPRGGAIRLPEKSFDLPETIVEEDEETSLPTSPMPEPRSPGAVGSIGRRLGKKFSGYFSKGPTGGAVGSPGSPAVPLGIPGARARAASQGAAYGYSTATRARLASIAAASVHRGGLAASLARRRASLAAVDASAMGVQPGTSFGATIAAGRPSFAGSTADLSFAQRLVLANENAVTNIADLWVASAMNVDNEDVFESDTEEDIEDESFATEPAGSGFTVASGRTGASLAPSVQGPAGRRGSTASTVRAGLRRDTTPSLGPEELAARRASLLPGIFQTPAARTWRRSSSLGPSPSRTPPPLPSRLRTRSRRACGTSSRSRSSCSTHSSRCTRRRTTRYVLLTCPQDKHDALTMAWDRSSFLTSCPRMNRVVLISTRGTLRSSVSFHSNLSRIRA